MMQAEKAGQSMFPDTTDRSCAALLASSAVHRADPGAEPGEHSNDAVAQKAAAAAEKVRWRAEASQMLKHAKNQPKLEAKAVVDAEKKRITALPESKARNIPPDLKKIEAKLRKILEEEQPAKMSKTMYDDKMAEINSEIAVVNQCMEECLTCVRYIYIYIYIVLLFAHGITLRTIAVFRSIWSSSRRQASPAYDDS